MVDGDINVDISFCMKQNKKQNHKCLSERVDASLRWGQCTATELPLSYNCHQLSNKQTWPYIQSSIITGCCWRSLQLQTQMTNPRHTVCGYLCSNVLLAQQISSLQAGTYKPRNRGPQANQYNSHLSHEATKYCSSSLPPSVKPGASWPVIRNTNHLGKWADVIPDTKWVANTENTWPISPLFWSQQTSCMHRL